MGSGHVSHVPGVWPTVKAQKTTESQSHQEYLLDVHGS